MRFAHSVGHAHGEIVIAVTGEADLMSAEQLRQLLFDAMVQRPTRLTVDLGGLTFIDSASLYPLVAARRAARRHGCVFRVVKPQGQVLRVLILAGLLATLTGTDSAGEA
ncbi:STAS domain-containing protein [Planosporangium flavigriseum]|uniref:Anti-sigma factor antagonist n=1 Tax=Planosporangium flavigriseum TaxID=373681 RepID=A0A8J3PJX3_9ACTN|nr:STAS domain-containing protein [Planosporangium flavigriseum]NJC64879.1 STAS domain-containing protein [Planosporangium flavigriseum]GIG72751.1 hypothetical protein Pfl04_11550 [Planosporangium flavigriseum]